MHMAVMSSSAAAYHSGWPLSRGPSASKHAHATEAECHAGERTCTDAFSAGQIHATMRGSTQPRKLVASHEKTRKRH